MIWVAVAPALTNCKKLSLFRHQPVYIQESVSVSLMKANLFFSVAALAMAAWPKQRAVSLEMTIWGGVCACVNSLVDVQLSLLDNAFFWTIGQKLRAGLSMDVYVFLFSIKQGWIKKRTGYSICMMWDKGVKLLYNTTYCKAGQVVTYSSIQTQQFQMLWQQIWLIAKAIGFTVKRK